MMADTMNSMSMHHNHTSSYGGLGAGLRHSTIVRMCETEMLWNWKTDHVCFISQSWHATTGHDFYLSILAIFALALLTMMVSWFATQYDDLTGGRVSRKVADKDGEAQNARPKPPKPSLFKQTGKSLLDTIWAFLAYLLMLLVMTYNGYVIITILAGTFVGKFFFDWLVLRMELKRASWDSPAPASLEPPAQQDPSVPAGHII